MTHAEAHDETRDILPVMDRPPAHTQTPARGTILSFDGPHVTLAMRQERSEGEEPSWTLRGVVQRAGTGQSAIVIVRSADAMHYRTLADDEGIFCFRGLHDGVYDLTLVLDQQQEVYLYHIMLSM